MHFRAPRLRLEVAVIVLVVVLIGMLVVAYEIEWMERAGGANTARMVVNRPLSVAQSLSPRTTVIYTPSDEAIPNPERGFYRYIETRSSAPVAYDADILTDYFDAGIRLLYCIHYLDTFVDAPISADFLAHIEGNLATVRGVGLKCVVRFAYTDDDPTVRGEVPPFGDASKEWIEAHIAQLAPILQANADVIAFVQAGLIGVWGEWYYTDHFVDDPQTPWVVSDAQYARRFEVLAALLDAVPVTRTISIRYPFARQAMLQEDAPISPNTAYDGSPAARIGFHNDCFLASDTDLGTFREAQLERDKEYLATSTRSLPMGGESCASNPPRTSCATAMADLERFHWTYLNREFNEDVLAGWAEEGCLGAIEQRLGYRLVLMRGSFPAAVQVGEQLPISVELENAGFAAPVNPRPIQLILRQTPDGPIHILGLNADLRQWLPGVLHRIDDAVTVPADLPPGDYDLLLRLPDPAPALANQFAYNVRFANDATWDAETGANRLLHTLRVDPITSPTLETKIHLPWMQR